MNPWLKSARPKTLPLSISTILIGASLSNFYKPIDWFLFGLLIVIAVSLQILSNFANDYGDFQKGTDQKAQRNDRMLTSGAISADQMKHVLWVLSAFVLFVGCYTVWYGYNQNKESNLVYFGALFVFGLLAIAAAILYTVGKKAYGYYGLGDLFVFLFFFIVSVMGTSIVCGISPTLSTVLGAIGMGLLSVSILNINNYRDLMSDLKSNKKTIAVKLGEKRTLTYQRFLLVFGFLGVFSSIGFYLYQLLNLSGSTYYIEMFLLFGVFSPSAVFLSRYHSEMKALLPGNREELNKLLKNNSLTILLLCLVHFALSLYIGSFFQ